MTETEPTLKQNLREFNVDNFNLKNYGTKLIIIQLQKH